MRIILGITGILIYIYSFTDLYAGVLIKGKAPQYAGEEISFQSYTEWITRNTKDIAKTTVSDSGDFFLHIETNETTYIFTHLGIYRCYMYIEPGKEYLVELPPKENKKPEDILNPYFEPVKIQIGIRNSNEEDINVLIRMFDDRYNPYYNKHVNEILMKTFNFETLDKDLKTLEQNFSQNQNTFFSNYRKYRYAMMRHLALQQKSRSVSDDYFKNQPVLYYNPAYMELFNQIYDGYFMYFGRTTQGEQIYTDINKKKSFRSLCHTLSKDEVLQNDTLKELVVIKNIYDEFYRDNFSRSGLLALLDSMIAKSQIDKHKKIASLLKEDLTKLAVGHKPPYFELYDAHNKLVKLTDFEGKYVYLSFCSCQSYTCLNQFEMLSGIYQRHNKYLEILTISLDPYEDTFRTFIQKHNYTWRFLYYENQPEIIKQYDIRGFPTYFLIAPDGTLVYSPAASPEESFEGYLYKAMKSRGDL